ncbi:hypothetical protein [Undibacterium baiyunense]|uniref:Uncharacterized protein n=1 Tax=Undibacterium baiyunense TaxID=2828731 RepID=A0A941DFW1_9BURK|nr:hypothetical protein [Undibacterium baiyunense]MBR7747989.1 hypothetical protein [Undibacterium baiyunense]
MQDISLFNEAIAALKQSSTLMKSWIEKNPAGAGSFNEILGRLQQVSSDALQASQDKPTVTSSPNTVGGSAYVGVNNAAEVTSALLSSVNAMNQLKTSAQSNVVPAAQQNVVDSSMRSNYVYTTNGNSDKTLVGLEDKLRRASDAYDAAVAKAESGYCSWIPSQNGLPVYQTKEQIIENAKNDLLAAQKMFDTHQLFLADPASRSMAEVAFQIKYGGPSEGGVELSRFEQFLVQERRAGNNSTDGSIAALFQKMKT